MSKLTSIGLLCSGLLLASVGCQSQTIGKVAPASENLRTIGQAYTQATDKMNRAPKNFEELLPFLKDKGDPEQLKRSPEDNEDFVIYWGVDYRTFGGQGPPMPLLAFEKNGKRGSRWVFALMNMTTLLTEDEMKKLPLPPGQMLPF